MGHMKVIHSLKNSLNLSEDELLYFEKIVKDAIDSGHQEIYYKNEKLDTNYAKYLMQYHNNNADGTQFKRPEGQ